jgi:hypothetical protein
MTLNILTGKTCTKRTKVSMICTIFVRVDRAKRADVAASSNTGVVVKSGTCGITGATTNGKTTLPRVLVTVCFSTGSPGVLRNTMLVWKLD